MLMYVRYLEILLLKGRNAVNFNQNPPYKSCQMISNTTLKTEYYCQNSTKVNAFQGNWAIHIHVVVKSLLIPTRQILNRSTSQCI